MLTLRVHRTADFAVQQQGQSSKSHESCDRASRHSPQQRQGLQQQPGQSHCILVPPPCKARRQAQRAPSSQASCTSRSWT